VDVDVFADVGLASTVASDVYVYDYDYEHDLRASPCPGVEMWVAASLERSGIRSRPARVESQFRRCTRVSTASGPRVPKKLPSLVVDPMDGCLDVEEILMMG
jgi:hypothetical protein